jgi:hypothetical protein
MAFIQLMSRSIRLTSQLRNKKITPSEARAIGRAIDRRMKVLEDELKSGRISCEAALDRECRAALPRSFRKSG